MDLREHGVSQPASRCGSKWSEMSGDARVRQCARCQQNVYRFGSLDPFEVRQLLIEKEGKPCVRFFDRGDGSVMVKDCPRGQLRRWNLRFALVSAVLLALFGGSGFVLASGGVPQATERALKTFEAKPPPPVTDADLQCLCGMRNFAQNNAY
ncbi:MAG: hypothetical protein QM723_22230 [Myxococcaceae bacterium]